MTGQAPTRTEGATAGPAAPDMVALDVLLDRPGFFGHPFIPPSHTSLSSE